MAVAAEKATLEGKGWPFLLQWFKPDNDYDYKALSDRIGVKNSTPAVVAAGCVRRDMTFAHKMNIRATPTFIILSDAGSRRILSSAQIQERFKIL